MPSLIIIGHLKTSGGAARQKVVDALTDVANYAQANEPGVFKYCIALPIEGDDKSVFAIEEYADQSAMDKHMACEAVGQLLKIFSSDPSTFADSPTIYGLPNKLSTSISFTRPELGQAKDPLVVFANFGYQEGLTSQAVPGWTALVKHVEEKEPGTFTFSVLADEEKGFIRLVEAYESAKYFEQVHEKSEAVTSNKKQNGAMRTGVIDIYRLKMVGGYLYKETPEESKARL